MEGWAVIVKGRQRGLIYLALMLLCSVISLAAGMSSGVWSFLQAVAALEFVGMFFAHSGQQRFQIG